MLYAHGSRSWGARAGLGVHHKTDTAADDDFGNLSAPLPGAGSALEAPLDGIGDEELTAGLSAAEAAQRSLSQELNMHELIGTGAFM